MSRARAARVLIAVAETLRGNLRLRYLNRLVDDRRARQIGVFTGSTIISAIALASPSWIGTAGRTGLLAVGAQWLALDVAFGRWLFKASWQRIGAEVGLRRGGPLGLARPFVLFAPLLAAMPCGLI